MKKHLVGKPNIVDKERFLSRVSDILDSKVLTNNAKYVQELEGMIAAYHHVPYAVAFCNATLALELVLSTLPAGEILLPAFTFIATAQAVKRAGHKPVFVDCVEDGFGMDPDKAILKMNNKVRAILAVNLFGHTVNIKELENLASWYDSQVIYDSAHSLGMTETGGNGLCEVYSMHATKLCNSIEGGVLVTRNKLLANKMRAIRNFGYASGENLPPEGIFYNPYLATNAKMSEIHAAMGVTNFEAINYLKSEARTKFKQYLQQLPAGVRLRVPNAADSNFSYISCEVSSGRDKLVEHLRERDIFARCYFNYLCPDIVGERGGYYPRATRLTKTLFCLPTGLETSSDDINYITSTIGEFLSGQ